MFVLGLLLTSLICYGQYPSSGDGAGFTVNQIKGCVPLHIKVSDNLPDDDPGVYIFNWKGSSEGIINPGNKPDVDTTYTEVGVYTIIQIDNNSGIDSIQIEVLDTLQPQYKVYKCEDNGVYVDFSEEDYYDSLQIGFGGGVDTTVATNTQDNGISHSYNMLDTYTITVKGIFADAETNCAAASTTLTTTDALKPAVISQVAVLSQDSIQIDYNSGDDNISYQLQVAQGGEDFTSAATYGLDSNVDSLIITGLDDTRQHYYCFRIVTLNRCDPDDIPQTADISDTLCSIALQATAENLQNGLTWQTATNDFEDYNVFRGGEVIGNTANTNFTDTDSIVCQTVYDYQVNAEKGNMLSISELISLTAVSTDTSTALTSFAVAPSNKAIQLRWDVQEAPEATKFYIYREGNGTNFQRYDSVIVDRSADAYEPPNNIYAFPDSVAVEETYCYQVSYVDACGNESELSTQYCIELPRQAKMVFPNVFTPNEDGLNDVFLYKGNLIEQIELKIFNRWGELLFHTDQVDVGWDGTYKGATAPEGVYLYQASITDRLGNRFNMQGSLTLLIP